MKKTTFTKLLLSLSLCLIMCVSVFAGCTLVTKDMENYYSQVVATLEYENNEKIEITKKDLSMAVANYYEEYQSYGITGEEAIKLLLDRAINEKLVIRASENLCKENNNGQILTDKEKTYLWEMTFDSIKNNIISYYNEMNNIEDSGEQSTSTDETVVKQSVYSSPVTLNIDGNGNYTLTLNETPTTIIEEHIFWSEQNRDVANQNDLQVLYENIQKFVAENSVYSQAYSRYLTEAKKSEEGLNLFTNSDEVFKREITRVYEILYDAFMVDKYAEMTQKNNSTVTVNNILNLYSSKVASDYNKYQVEKAGSYEDDVLESVGEVNYFKTSGTQFFYVSHILAKFSDGQQQIYDECQKVLDGQSTKYTVSEAEAIIDDLYTNLTFLVREPPKDEDGNIIQDQDGNIEWVETAQRKSVSEVFNEINLKLETAGDDSKLKAEYFNEFIYKYNEDEGIMNAERNYVIGVDYTTPDAENGTNYTVYSEMVESFTNAAVELYNYGNAKIGDVYANLIRSDYGIHIMVYEGKVENVFTNIDSSFKLNLSDIEILNSTRLKAGEEKTILDALYEELVTDKYTLFENMNIQFLRSEVKITYYPDAYKDLY